MKLKKEFVTVLDGEGAVTVSTDTDLFSGMIRSNSVATFILDCLKKDTEIDQIVDQVTKEYDVEKSIAEKDIIDLVDQLKKINALDE